jgi:hypothetical protein
VFGFLFYLIWRSVGSLPTYPFKGSKPIVVHSQNCFWWVVVDFTFFENRSLKKRKEALKT